MNDYRLFHDAFRASLSTNGDYLMHYGRRGMRWGKSIYQDDYVPKGKEASGDEDGNQWWEDAYNTARNAYNTAKQGIQNFGNEAERQAHHARGYASVAANAARNGINNVGVALNRAERRANQAIGRAAVNGALRAAGNGDRLRGGVRLGVNAINAIGDARRNIASIPGRAVKAYVDVTAPSRSIRNAGRSASNAYDSARRELQNFGNGVRETGRVISGTARNIRDDINQGYSDASKVAYNTHRNSAAGRAERSSRRERIEELRKRNAFGDRYRGKRIRR